MSYVEVVSPRLARAIALSRQVKRYEAQEYQALPPVVMRPPAVVPVPWPWPIGQQSLTVQLSPRWTVGPEGSDEPPEEDFVAHRKTRGRSIMIATCEWFGCTRTELLSKRHDKTTVLRRFVAMYLCKELTTESLAAVGRRFGGYDHTSVMHAVAKTRRILDGTYMLNRLALYEGRKRQERVTHTAESAFASDIAKVRTATAAVEGIRELLRTQAGF